MKCLCGCFLPAFTMMCAILCNMTRDSKCNQLQILTEKKEKKQKVQRILQDSLYFAYSSTGICVKMNICSAMRRIQRCRYSNLSAHFFSETYADEPKQHLTPYNIQRSRAQAQNSVHVRAACHKLN